MKYCIKARQPLRIRKKADELFLEWKDKEFLSQLIIENPEAKIILQVPEKQIAPIKQIEQYISEGAKITLALEDLVFYKEYKNIPYYLNKKISNYWDLRNIIELGVSEILLDAPLYFDLESVFKFGLPIRLVANCATHFSTDNGIKGTYIRPEDVIYYEQYVSTLEFHSDDLTQEETLLRIYQEDQEWKGNLNKIIHFLRENLDNRGVVEPFAKIRMNCKQRCMRTGTCHFCDNTFIFGNSLEKLKQDLDSKN